MADHLDAPDLTSPAMDARVDITDHYAFQKPDHPERTILILNVNPLAPTHAAEFRSDAVYETLVDTNGDAQPEIFRVANPLVRRLMSVGVPTGSRNILLTVRGRRSGKPRTTPLGMLELDGRMF